MAWVIPQPADRRAIGGGGSPEDHGPVHAQRRALRRGGKENRKLSTNNQKNPSSRGLRHEVCATRIVCAGSVQPASSVQALRGILDDLIIAHSTSAHFLVSQCLLPSFLLPFVLPLVPPAACLLQQVGIPTTSRYSEAKLQP